MVHKELIIKMVKRSDGRKANELRPMMAKVGVVPNADGSAMFAFGNTIAIAAASVAIQDGDYVKWYLSQVNKAKKLIYE